MNHIHVTQAQLLWVHGVRAALNDLGLGGEQCGTCGMAGLLTCQRLCTKGTCRSHNTYNT